MLEFVVLWDRVRVGSMVVFEDVGVSVRSLCEGSSDDDISGESDRFSWGGAGRQKMITRR